MADFDDDLIIGDSNAGHDRSGSPSDRIIPQTERFFSLFRNRTSHIIAVVNQKGGCGKTTTAINLAASLAAGGYKVLVVDTDPQAQASLGVGVDVPRLEASIYDVLIHGATLESVVQPAGVKNLFIAPAQSGLSGAQLELASFMARESVLKLALDDYLQAEHFDFILIDCSPTLNLVTINALTAAHSVLVPFQTHYFSLEGMKELFETIDIVKERLNPMLSTLGIAVTLFDKRLKVNHEIDRQIREYFGDLVFDTRIHLNVKLCEAPMHRVPVIVYAPKSTGSKEYQALAREVIMRCHSSFSGSHKLRHQSIVPK